MKPSSPDMFQLMRSGAVVAIGRVVGLACSFVLSVMLARGLCKQEFGDFNLLVTAATFSAAIGKFGLDKVALKCISGSADVSTQFVFKVIKRIARFQLVTLAIALGLMAAGLAYVSSTRGEPIPVYAVGLALTSMVLVTFQATVAEFFRGLDDLPRATLFDAQKSGPILAPLILLAVSFLLMNHPASLHLSSTLALLCTLQLAIFGFSCYELIRKSKSLGAGKPQLESPELTGLAALGASFAGIEVLGVVMNVGDIWIAGLVMTPSDFGSWCATAQITQLTIVPLTIANLAVASKIPRLANAKDTANLQELLRGAASIAMSLAILPIASLIIFPREVLTHTFGESFLDASAPVAIVAAGKLLFTWTGPCGLVLMLTGRPGIALVNNGLSAIVILVGGTLAASSYGTIGLACVVSAVTGISNLVNLVAAWIHAGIWTHADWAFWPRQAAKIVNRKN